jgi:hypothetical protein
MLFEPDSVLRQLPENLNPVQVMFCDGIRYAVDMADEAYWLTAEALLRYGDPASRSDRPRDLTTALIGAWSFIDSIHRLHRVLGQTPRLKNTPNLTVFKRKLEPVEEFRHGIQHLEGTLNKIDPAEPTMGYLSWFMAGEGQRHHLCTVVPGSTKSAGYQTVDPFNKELRAPIDLIELAAFERRISLTDLHDALVGFAPRFERAAADGLERAGTSAETRGSDFFVSVEIEFTTPPDEMEPKKPPGLN